MFCLSLYSLMAGPRPTSIYTIDKLPYVLKETIYKWRKCCCHWRVSQTYCVYGMIAETWFHLYKAKNKYAHRMCFKESHSLKYLMLPQQICLNYVKNTLSNWLLALQGTTAPFCAPYLQSIFHASSYLQNWFKFLLTQWFMWGWHFLLLLHSASIFLCNRLSAQLLSCQQKFPSITITVTVWRPV